MATKRDASPLFGTRKEPHTIIIARGDDVTHFTLRPRLAAMLGTTLIAAAVGCLFATSYFVFRDDLRAGSTARQSRLQQAYEDRISLLRAQVDRITSRQLLDQKLMETKVSELLQRQSQLADRHGKINAAIERAEQDLPGQKLPSQPADPNASQSSLTPEKSSRFALWDQRGTSDRSVADQADKVFVSINQSLRAIEKSQLDRIADLADRAYQSAGTITETLQQAGLTIDAGTTDKDVGGPFVPVNPGTAFDDKVHELDAALDLLDRTRREAQKLPILNPAPGHPVSSTFGVRKDPLLGSLAMHTGMDFRAAIGFPAEATAAGVVTKAGWNGGYGRMVEIDHGSGYATRYAHLSQIDVVVGQKVAKGEVVGNVGTSGRSTGPHLHYEVRRQGDAVDPLPFIKVGAKLAPVL